MRILTQTKKSSAEQEGLLKYVIAFIFLMISQTLFAGSLDVVTTKDNTPKETKLIGNFNKEGLQKNLIYAKEMQVLSQAIAKDYFYINQLVHEEKAKFEITQSIQEIDKAFAVLSSTIQNDDVLNMITYLKDTQAECKELIEKNYSKENGSIILDYSETMSEGAKQILKYLETDNEEYNIRYDVILQQKFILQRISKFYIAFQAGFDEKVIIQQLEDSIKQFDLGLLKISGHKYSDELLIEVARVKKYWPLSKKFYQGIEKGDLTLVVYISTDHMMTSLDKLIASHELLSMR